MPVILSQPVSACKVWIDGVGCWLICFESTVTFGNQIAEAGIGVKVPIQANLRTKHLSVECVEGGYWIEASGDAQIDGIDVRGRQAVCHATKILLNREVDLRFELPSQLSSSSRVTIESGHRFDGGVNGVVMLQGVCLLGHGREKHIHCRDWSADVVLFVKNRQLCCKAGGQEITIDGASVGNVAEIKNGSHLESEEWSMRFEEVC